MRSRTHVVCGLGEVGSALAAVLDSAPASRVVRVDPAKGYELHGAPQDVDFLHVCIPYGDHFEQAVRGYHESLSPDILVIHSSVPVGTTRLIGSEAVHSPIEGLHPHLKRSIRTFPKWFGGEKAAEAAAPFQELGIRTRINLLPETTELAKLLSTSAYGIDLLKAKEQAQICRQTGVSYQEAVLAYSKDYNESYAILGRPEYCRPLLFPPQGPIGGHCVLPNARLLSPGHKMPLHRHLAEQ